MSKLTGAKTKKKMKKKKKKKKKYVPQSVPEDSNRRDPFCKLRVVQTYNGQANGSVC